MAGAPTPPLRIKVCGVTRVEDALEAVDAGADAIGLNFYADSKRCVERSVTREIADAIGPRALLVGVFVNHAADEINRLVDDGVIRAIQLHGDEPGDFVEALPSGVPVIRAMRVGSEGLAPTKRLLAEATRLGRPYASVLLDAAGTAGPGGTKEYGGTGHTADWERIVAERDLLGDTPLVLAGGLTPENVADAIAAVRPDGVDTASGVESAPGVKDRGLTEAFVAAARTALDRPQ